MSKISCDGGDASVPCRCDPVTGCGHLSSWHRVFERWAARCLVPGCDCKVMDVCDCCDGYNSDDSDAFLVSIGIKKGDGLIL